MNDRTPRYRDIRVGSNVLRTAVWEGKGPGRPLLFFNGIGANIELIAPLAEAMPDRDIIAFDAPGVGGSPAAADYDAYNTYVARSNQVCKPNY